MRFAVAARLWILSTTLIVGCDTSEGVAGPRDRPQDRDASVIAAAGMIYQLGDFALYVPAGLDAPRAVIVALGSRNAKGFATGEPFGAPPLIEAQLQAMGQSLRDLADEQGVAILGTSLGNMSNGAVSDQRILDALGAGAEASGRVQLSSIPLVMFGFLGGAPEASGFAARHPARVAGVLLKVPLGVTALTTEAQRRVPALMVLAEPEVFVDNVALGQAFAANRAGGALWAIAKEPGVRYTAFTPAFITATREWLSSVLDRRLAGSSGQTHKVAAQSGWLGDPSTGEVAPWGRYRGDRLSASWFPTRQAAEQWRILIGAAAGN